MLATVALNPDVLQATGPSLAPGPPALWTAHGALVVDPIQKAQSLADFFAEISAPPPTTVAARAAVLQTVQDHGTQLTTEDDTTVGGLTATCEEVQKALKKTQPGKSPGWDGIPADLCKAYRAQLGPMLATLYTVLEIRGRSRGSRFGISYRLSTS